MGEKWMVKFSLTMLLPPHCKAATWDRQLYFPSEGRHAEDFSPKKSDSFSRV
jgi:hypothetical protein